MLCWMPAYMVMLLIVGGITCFAANIGIDDIA